MLSESSPGLGLRGSRAQAGSGSSGSEPAITVCPSSRSLFTSSARKLSISTCKLRRSFEIRCSRRVSSFRIELNSSRRRDLGSRELIAAHCRRPSSELFRLRTVSVLDQVTLSRVTADTAGAYDDDSYDHNRWFFGEGLGYAIGWNVKLFGILCGPCRPFLYRGARIRTGDLLLPKQARYQPAPRPADQRV